MNKDHGIMTGGTIAPVKIIEVQQETYKLYVPHIMLSDFNPSDPFHMGSHTLEHYLAYSNGLRDSATALT
jgi:hypothetical protein